MLRSNRRILVTLAAFAAALAATSLEGGTVHGAAFALRLLGASLALGWWPDGGRLRTRDVVAPGLALPLLAAGAATSPAFGPAAQQLVTGACVVALYLAAAAAPTRPWRQVAPVAAAVIAVHAVWALAEVASGAGQRGSGGFFSPNDLAAVAAPLLVVSLDRGRVSARARGAWLGAAAILGAAIVATASRAGLLAAGLGVAILAAGRLAAVGAAARHGRARGGAGSPASRRWRMWGGAGVAAAVVVLAVSLSWWRFAGRGDPYSYSRLAIWGASASLAREHPLGVGLGAYADAMRRHGVELPGPVRFPKRAEQAHSEPLQAWVELGWPGLLLALLAPLLLVVSIARRAGTSGGADASAGTSGEGDASAGEAPPSAAADLGVLAAFAVPALVSSSLHLPPVALLAGLWAGDVVQRGAAAGGGAWVRLPRRRVMAPALVAVLALAVPGAAGDLLLDTAVRRRDAGDLLGALAAATWAERLVPWSVGAAMLVESLLGAARSPEESAAALEQLGERFPDSPRPLERAGWLLEGAAQHAADPGRAEALWRAAHDLYGRAADRDPKSGSAWYASAHAAAAAHDGPASRAAIARALAVEPNHARALALLALLAQGAGEPAAAADAAQRAWAAHDLAPREAAAAAVLRLDEPAIAALRAAGLAEPATSPVGVAP